MIALKGMTWDHPRGFDPMVATSEFFKKKHNNFISIAWDKRPLQAFADRPIEQMTEDYDLIVIDYPHLGEVAANGLLDYFDKPQYLDQLSKLKKESVGNSHQSYFVDDHQWALAIDAATQVSVFRKDLINFLPSSWNELVELAKNNKILWPLKPIHAISSFYSICNNIDKPFNPDLKEFINKKTTIRTLMMMKEIVKYLPNECLQMDPIQACEYMAENNDIFYCPYIYGFSNYSRYGFKKNVLLFSNVIDLEGNGPVGTQLGGTGIAVSKASSFKEEAFEYALWVASSDCQKNIYYKNGGQPGNAVAWENEIINKETNNFFSSTRDTLEGAWVRPRHNGYMKFQDLGGDIINDFLKNNLNEEDIYDKLNYEFKKSFVQ